jgi:hypothetical protein
MEILLRYRGKTITGEDAAFVRRLIEENPDESRRSLSKLLCRAWNWTQPNGELRDQVCRSLLLELERAGHLRLPEKKCSPPNPLVRRARPDPPCVDQTPLSGSLREIGTLRVMQVRRSPLEKLFNSLIEHCHYLGYCQPVGEHLKYLILLEDRPIACLSWCSAPRHIGCRDRFIGWSPEVRQKNLHLIAINNRFLIMPWVRVPHLASHLLSKILRGLSLDWQKIYSHPIHFVETFVDTERFRGTCYQAVNWVHLGLTTGLGKDAHSKKPNRSIKAVWGYPLSRNFREILCR